MKTIESLISYLRTVFPEREEVINGIILGIGAKQHVLLIGPPGTAKSLLARTVAHATGKKFFGILMSPFCTPEEFVGPLDISALQQGRYVHVTTNMLPEAQIAFLDEVFKANATVNNLLLTIINERLFYNGSGTPVSVPLESVIAASNELPAADEQRDQAAFADRFLLRYVVDYLREKTSFTQMLANDADIIANAPKISPSDLHAFANAAASVKLTEEVIQTVASIREQCIAQGLINSDRRYKDSLSVIKANAALQGRTETNLSDLDIMRHILWHEPGQRAQVNKIVLSAIDPLLFELEQILLDAREVAKNALEADDTKSTDAGLEANKKLKSLLKQAENIQPNSSTGIQKKAQVIQEIKATNQEVLRKCLGIG